jgi:hypothetical protein
MPNPVPPMSEATRKRITIPAKPADPDAWVHQAAPPPPPSPPAERLVRLSIDVPVAVRKALKNYVNDQDTSIQDLVRGFIEARLRETGYLR